MCESEISSVAEINFVANIVAVLWFEELRYNCGGCHRLAHPQSQNKANVNDLKTISLPHLYFHSLGYG